MNIKYISSNSLFIFLSNVTRKSRGDTITTIGNSIMLDFNKCGFSSVIVLGTEILFISTSFFFHTTQTVKSSNFFLRLLYYGRKISLNISISGFLQYVNL